MDTATGIQNLDEAIWIPNCPNTLRERCESNYFSGCYEWIVGQTQLFNLDMATSFRERKLNSTLLNCLTFCHILLELSRCIFLDSPGQPKCITIFIFSNFVFLCSFQSFGYHSTTAWVYLFVNLRRVCPSGTFAFSILCSRLSFSFAFRLPRILHRWTNNERLVDI